MLTSLRVEPTGFLVAIIDRLIGVPGSPLRVTFAPALRPGDTRNQESMRRQAELNSAERRVLIVATFAVAADQHQRAIEVVEQYLERCSTKTNPRIYERLAASYLAIDRAQDAIDVINSGLDCHEGSPGLNLMLINAYGSKTDWVNVLSVWEKLPRDIQIGADAWTIISVVRARRLTGHPEIAEELARDAVASWPDNGILQQELRICRPHVIDWPRSWVSDGGKEGTRSAHGTIESTGFLKGGSLPLVGWIEACVEDDQEVRLTVNGTTVARTFAAPVPDERPQKKFSINCAELLQYVGDGDVVEVWSESDRLNLPGIGRSAQLNCGYASQIDALFDKLDRGFVFTKDGQLLPQLTIDRKRALLDFFGAVCRAIEAHSSQPVYPFYGNLLGAIRDADFIGHDIGGFDMLYLSSAGAPAKIRSEIVSLCILLIEKGFQLTLKPHSVMIRHVDHSDCLVDLSYGWFDPDDRFNVSFGWRFQPAEGRDHFVASRHCRMVDRNIRVPGNAEEVLVQLYGPHWQIPDQGFSIGENLQRVGDCLLSNDEIRSINRH